MNKIRLIVFEGADGAGKETQSRLLAERLEAEGVKIRWLSFPDYQSESSGPVKMYLGGKLGENPDDTNAYAAASFFAIDRYIFWQTKWKKDFEGDEVFIANRYTTSNMLFQTAKLPREERPAFLEWLSDLEYNKFGLPRPDLVYYLDLPAELSAELTARRSVAQDQPLDIHETHLKYQKDVIQTARELALNEGWVTVPCSKNGVLLSKEEIAAIIYNEYCNLKQRTTK